MQKDYSKEFKTSKKYKKISLITLFSGILVSIILLNVNAIIKLESDTLIIISMIILFSCVGISCFFMHYIRCPNCGYLFDVRVSLRFIDNCPGCGVKLAD